jgi:DNA (cytosine-5)-methyltransferase 1
MRGASVLSAVDLFSGCGGFSLGAALANVAVKAAVEIDSHACATYRQNLMGTKIASTILLNTDILSLPPKSLMIQANIKSGDIDLLIGGPPCQGFSTHRLNDSGVSDPRNELLVRYFNFVQQLRPAAFLVENVPGLLWPRHKKWLAKFRRLAFSANYYVHNPVILNAKDFGVPQNRKRVFLFGHDAHLSNSMPWVPKATHGDPNSIEAKTGKLRAWIPAKVAFLSPPKGDKDNRHMRHSKELEMAFRATPKNGGLRFQSGRTLPCHRSHDGHFDVYGRIDPRRPAPTMTTACINPSKGRFVHPTQSHGITVRQAARLQSFPDWFVFQGGLMSAGVQIGNAVPPLMAKALLQSIASWLDNASSSAKAA